ncbi:hypothetical protein [Arsenicicoccus dermatophilus]|uniref:hypothetical protein n=1 Tax=Arsenicicoccus dermatophilus TaxID=1076331 RepID=UPI0039172270
MTTTETTIYGASDDLIEIDGPLYEEFAYPYDADHVLVACSNGVLLRVAYTDDGVWRITPLAGADKVTIKQCPLGDDDDCTDRATITEPLTWIAMADQYSLDRKATQS